MRKGNCISKFVAQMMNWPNTVSDSVGLGMETSLLFVLFFYYRIICIIDDGASRRRTRISRFRARRADHSTTWRLVFYFRGSSDSHCANWLVAQNFAFLLLAQIFSHSKVETKRGVLSPLMYCF